MVEQVTIKRKEFLSKMGLSAGAIIATYCLGGLVSCSDNGVSPSGSVDFNIDLTNATYSALNTVGGWVRTNGVVIANVAADTFVAVTQTCSHEGKTKVTYRHENGDFYCTEHGARFDLDGGGLNSTGSRGITVYATELSGTTLRIFG
ncbi:MAG: Rieske 2Fe-2S domain-containing protein [Flammeovirgaceae bacterium]|jgi:cytochrome b6-f complex iron-sulfur subunit|nr:Rieske 2Fe-2S domain-containing protein [Flammeovirgaceae bacterium]|tara:strand:+ start:16598 stop:17038 length:441 start_codon:yes stop_codon:yes gene_type:complete